MSTKIYNGYRIKKCSIDELFDLFAKLRDEFMEVTQDLVNKLAMEEAVNTIDNFSLGIDFSEEDKDKNLFSKDKDGNIKSHIWYLFMKNISEAFHSIERSPKYDFSIKCTVLKTDLSPGYFYFIFYYEKKSIKR